MALRRIDRDQARIGMFIHAFEGSWFSHPFWRTQFTIDTPEQLVRVLESDMLGLVIDETRGVALAPTARVAARSEKPQATASAAATLLAPELRRSDKAEAARCLRESARAMKQLMAQARLGRPVDPADVRPLIAALGRTLERAPRALLSLARLKTKDAYTFQHSVAVAALTMTLARRLGLSGHEVDEFGVGGLLHDIGKMAVPEALLRKPASLTDAELATVRTHPEQGWLLLSEHGRFSATVLDMCRLHHERIDGTGYPLRLTGDRLSLPARVAAICDVYDAITSDRPYKRAWTPVEAITRMATWQGHFDEELLFAFMQAVGVFPVGTLVRLRSNRLGVVVDNGRRSSRPKVRAFFDTCAREMIAAEDVVIDDHLAADQIVAREAAADWGLPDWSLLSEQILTRSGRYGRRAA